LNRINLHPGIFESIQILSDTYQSSSEDFWIYSNYVWCALIFIAHLFYHLNCRNWFNH